MKKKELYEAPRTKITEVELENGFMGGSVVNKDEINPTTNPVDAGDQEINGNFDFTENEWQTN